MKIPRVLLLLAACCATGAWSADSGRLPNRQIDRPIILPAKMWQERLIQNSLIQIEGGTALDDETVHGFLPSLPAWSITDNLHWSAVPAPLFRYLLTRNNINAENGPVAKGLSLTLDGGVNSVVYATGELEVVSVLGLTFKQPISYRFWTEGHAHAYITNVEDFVLGAALGAGFQISERTHGIATYVRNQFSYYGPLLQGLTLETGINFNPGLSLGFQLSVLAGGGKTYLNPGANISFQW